MKQIWTPVAAWCLALLMIGATIVTIDFMGILPAIFPVITGILLVAVACGRMKKVS